MAVESRIGEQDLRMVGTNNHLTKEAGIGFNGTSLGTGAYNIGIGTVTYNLPNSSSMTGDSNIALGKLIYTAPSTGTMSGSENTAIGRQLFQMQNGNLAGYNNIGMGTGLYTMQSGNMASGSNIALGGNIYTFNKTTGALFTGGGNTSIGQTIFALTNGDLTGGNNIGMGQAQYTLTSGNMAGSRNIGIGQTSYYVVNGDITGTATNNIALGSKIYRLTNTSTSTFSGANNIGIGGTLYNLSSGNLAGGHNIGIGNDSYYVKNGDITNNSEYNIALGDRLYRLENSATSTFSGYDNIAIGYGSFRVLSGDLTGYRNIAIGDNVFYLSGGNLSGHENIGIGANTLNGGSGGITGVNNIVLVSRSMQALGGISGGYNVALGYQSLSTNGNLAGTENIAIGYSALRPDSSDNIGSHNIGIGSWALYREMGRGNANIQIGNLGTGTPVAGQLNNVVAIGNEMSGLSTTITDSNVILLGKTGSNAPKVGIGTYKPGAKLEINNGTTAGAVKIVDGTEGAGKVLTSDANGLATWKRQALTLIEGVKGSGISIPPSTTGYIYTGSYITLPPGKYMVSVQNLITVGFPNYSNGHFWLRTTFSDSNTTFVRTADIDSTKGFLISGLLPQGARFSMLNGSLIIENTTSSPKTYYYWAGDVEATPGTTIPLENFGGWAEWSMTATPIQ